MHHSIRIIGAGVSGLSCGLSLLEAGCQVEIVAAEAPMETTSAAAAGIWMPFHAGDNPRTGIWTRSTYDYCRAMAANAESGIFFIDHKAYFLSPHYEAQKEMEAADGFRLLPESELKYGAQAGFSVRLPVMPSDRFLPFLTDRFLSLGGTFSWRRIGDLSAEAEGADLLVNCTGYGARGLCQDATLEAAKGHVLLVANPGFRENIIVTDGDTFTHIFPCGDRCILGGVYQAGNTDLTPDASVTADILERAAALEPAFKGAKIIAIRTVLRPARPAVRLEIEILPGGVPVIHNYGHGGAGYTLCYGCAEDVAALASDYFAGAN